MSENDLLLADCERALIDALDTYDFLIDLCIDSGPVTIGQLERKKRHVMDLLDHLIAFRKGSQPEGPKNVRFAHTLTPVKGAEIE